MIIVCRVTIKAHLHLCFTLKSEDIIVLSIEREILANIAANILIIRRPKHLLMRTCNMRETNYRDEKYFWFTIDDTLKALLNKTKQNKKLY